MGSMVEYIGPKELAQKIRDGKDKILIVDVRDSDYEVKMKESKHCE